MHRLKRRFHKARSLRHDCFVADYTEYTASQVGVVMSETPFDDIEAFHLQSGRHPVSYLAVNLEEHPSFIKHIENCECFFLSTTPCDRPWLLFLELKYCKARNIGSHAAKAIHQMACVLRKLVDENVIEADRYRIYFNYSSPSNNRRQPFTHFMHTPADVLDLIEQYDAYYLGFNHLIIAGPQFIRAPKIRI
ncbi:MAG: hypothetical protein K1V80_05050 [Muribaculaceae bacterium]